MKPNIWIVSTLASLTAVMVMAQQTPPAPPVGAAAPAPAHETAPAAPKKKASPARKRVVLDAPATAVVKSANVNVRGQASFVGETLGHLQKGDTVTVLEEITLGHHAAEEPAQWARIAMPTNITIWVDGDYVDSETKTIKARRVNLRGGPGENYSVVGRLEKGASIKEIKSEKGWISIEAPTNAYAFVAAQFLDMQPAAPVAVVTPPPPAPTPAPAPAPEPQVVNVNTPAPPAVAANEPVATAPPAPAPSAPPPVAQPAPAVAATPEPVAPSEPVTPRVVTREGFVRRAYNIQAPTDFELHDIQSGTLIDYLQPQAGQKFKIFRWHSRHRDGAGRNGCALAAHPGFASAKRRFIALMPFGTLMDGRAIAGEIHLETARRVARVKAQGVQPCLIFIRAGEDPASRVYVGMKEKACALLGIQSRTHVLPAAASEKDLLALLTLLNVDAAVHGILVQAPLPAHISQTRVFSSVDPNKDVDGFHPINMGKLLLGDTTGFHPCTPAGIHALLIRSGVVIEGAEVVILGRGNIVGKPMSALLLQKVKHANATVTICHSHTRDLPAHCLRADILIAAMGAPEFVKAHMVKPGAVVVDVGVNRLPDPAARGGSRLVGDVDFAGVRPVAGKITPNPGGVGPMTIALLMQNTVRAAERAAGLAGSN